MIKTLAAATAILGAGVALSIVPANASPYPEVEKAICRALDNNPTDTGVLGVFIGVAGVADKGHLTDDQAAAIIADAIVQRCPQHYELVANWINKQQEA